METTGAELLRLGHVIFRNEGIYMPRGHLGDFTAESQRMIGLVGRGSNLWDTVPVGNEPSQRHQPRRTGRMQVLETISTEVVLAARMADLKTRWSTSDPPAAANYDVENLEFDPLKINQEVATYFELMLRDRVNQAARAVTLAFAVGTDLDAIGSRYPGGMPRIAGETDTPL